MKPAADAQLHAVEDGRGEGVPLVFLHGFGASAGMWSDIQRAFAGDHATIAYDLPGHGRSMLASGLERTGKMAGAIARDLEQRGHGRVHLVGHSMGGSVATLIALRAPGRIASMTLLAPGGYGPEINHRLLRRYASAGTRSEMLAALENMFGWNNAVPDKLLDDLVAARGEPGAAEGLGVILENMLQRDGDDLYQGTFRRADLAELQMPVKVLWGTQDRVLPTRQAHRLPPMFAAHVFENTGHMLIEERPDAVISLIRQNMRAA
ncbi:alpha/beta fold hydrolase [Hoeflea poritis]|uniref:Alpha/beta fold hydrolase n=1 Tax=Hoeflea poritis TaxID=2993659 RepID=A0ABT4VRM0_9HYPH|nr:alpha/beta fold hydrolase [Hoeflea poritis]MDA4847370.1 alpha/beta fold hydrolase [Hoeflea poritis]